MARKPKTDIHALPLVTQGELARFFGVSEKANGSMGGRRLDSANRHEGEPERGGAAHCCGADREALESDRAPPLAVLTPKQGRRAPPRARGRTCRAKALTHSAGHP